MDRLSYPEVQVALRLEVEECLWELEEEEETPRGVEEETLRGVEEETLKDVEEEALLTELEVGKGTNGPPVTQILTNHFNYKISVDKLWEYKITGISEKRKDKIKRIFLMAIEQWPFLKDHKDSFATNYLDTIVSWKNLHEHIVSEPTEHAGKPLTLWEKAVVDGDRTLDLSIRLNREYDISDFSEYAASEPNREGEDFESLARCLNMVVSKSFNKSEVHQQSANKFFVKNARKSLIFSKNSYGDPDVRSHTLELMRGYFYNVKPGMGSFIMNFSLATSAFYRPILVSEFLADTNTFTDEARRKEALKGLRVYVETERKDIPGEDHTRLNSEEARIKRVFALGADIGTLTFAKRVRGDDGKFRRDDNGNFVTEPTRTSVSRYLNETFDPFSLKTGQPAVNVGTMRDEIWFAQEQLRILPYQIYSRPLPESLTGSMVQEAAKTPADGRAHIEKEGLGALGFTPEQTKNATSTNFSSFFKTEPALLKYRFVIERRFKEANAELYHDQFQKELLNRCNLKANQLQDLGDDIIENILDRGSVSAKISQAKAEGANLVVFLLNKSSTPFYAHLKDLADRTHGIHSLCLVEQYKLIKQYGERAHLFQEYMTNVVMKINLKMGGITQSVTTVSDYLAKNRVMVLGADVVHAGPGAYPGTPSIAAIVGSVDFSAGKCLGSMRLQRIDTTDRETIVEVEDMVRERLEAWAAARKAESTDLGITEELPQSIIYYRDGVGTGQYETIKKIEVAAIRAAYNKLATQYGLSTDVKIHAVVVVKRHHTRFYPMNASEGDKFGNENTLPGTFVDRLVTSPYYQDFYLQSHSGIKGTVKPTHYFVLEAEIPGLTLDKLRDLTHQICYSYARALCAVSYASPTFYADRLCDRGRTYIRKYFVKEDSQLQTALDNIATVQNNANSANRDINFRIRPAMSLDQKKQMVKDKKEQEKKDADAVQKSLRDEVYRRVGNDFYMFEKEGWMNPWSRDLADTMFWM
ncbi:hypothetical protein SNOG_10566 [Parastagonospora nodorum SN15]|uniref:Piwi domain-containing protein n=1 Tax=Phaeosphaeria nodorum (strain SN15 / ATCC MYA-4574 / FGSC 10173) TaxID=321614 RepID=Q0UCE8_PHANO|nr:hypothetical protein SNOG_10566 [Parastagonospora nodorum SN15]EAT81960.2 hypothetical protein SNOG_10566 [Parastagonospora nodorum SN15]